MNTGFASDYAASNLDLEGACPTGGLRARLARQFGKPEGRLGRLAGLAMAFKNRKRGRWVLSLLNIEPIDRVIEVGFGAGQDLAAVAAAAAGGLAAGVDHSELMTRTARRRNMGAILAGRADIRQATATQIPFPDESFTKAFSVNSVQFWPDRRAVLVELRRVLRPGGLVAVALQPRGASSPELALANGRVIAADLEAAGFDNIRVETSTFGSVPTVCALGRKTSSS